MEAVGVAKILKFGGQMRFETAAQISEEGCLLAGGAPVSEFGGKARDLGLKSLGAYQWVELVSSECGVAFTVWANWIKLLLW